jgi:hypothetical protein
MRRLIAVMIVAVLIVVLAAPATHAGDSTTANVALGLAAFAVFNQLVTPILHPRVYAHTHVVEAVPVVSARPILYYPAAPVYPVPLRPVVVAPSTQSVVVAPPSPAPMPTVVQHPHGRYELRGDGIKELYTWVWIPNPPPPPAPQR